MLLSSILSRPSVPIMWEKILKSFLFLFKFLTNYDENSIDDRCTRHAINKILSFFRSNCTRKQWRNRLVPISRYIRLQSDGSRTRRFKRSIAYDECDLLGVHVSRYTVPMQGLCSLVCFVTFRQAEDLINNGFPRKIVELNDLLSTPLFSTKHLEEVHEDLKVPIPEPLLSNKWVVPTLKFDPLRVRLTSLNSQPRQQWTDFEEAETGGGNQRHSCHGLALGQRSLQLSHSPDDENCQTVHLAPGRRCQSGTFQFKNSLLKFASFSSIYKHFHRFIML